MKHMAKIHTGLRAHTPEEQWANSKNPGWEVLGKNEPA